jgi:hypothetical protein
MTAKLTERERINRSFARSIKDLARIDFQYLTEIPDAVPRGKVLVHNRVAPKKKLGLNGFRAWTQKPNEAVELCDCGWLGRTHYRVKRRLKPRQH